MLFRSYSPQERVLMLRNIYKGRVSLKIIEDINDLERWPYHILSKITETVNFHELELESCPSYFLCKISGVDAFYGGSEKDIYPFNKIKGLNINILDRTKKKNGLSATRIRSFLWNNDPSWRIYVPSTNWCLVEEGWEEYIKENNLIRPKKTFLNKIKDFLILLSHRALII